jgi:transposase InsO family protein
MEADVVRGLEKMTLPDVEHPCSVCIEAKQTRESYPRSEHTASKPLELIHSDLMFMPCEALGGEMYVLTILDDYSRFSDVVCINRKSSVTDELIAVLTRWQRQTGYPVKCVRTDQGTEYYGLDKYCREQGIIHEMSATYTPEQNGRAERLNRTLIERTRAILHEHNAPKLMWAYAIQVAAMLRNCMPSNGHKTMTPHQLLFDKKPNVEFLRVFGCAATVHTPKKKRDKLSRTSVQGVFIGYAKHSKAWRVLISAGYGSWQIIESSNVKFQEDTPVCYLVVNEGVCEELRQVSYFHPHHVGNRSK